MSSHFEQESHELADHLLNACATGKLARLKHLIPLYQAKPANIMPTPQFLLQTAALNGQAEVIRTIFQKPEIFQPHNFPWAPMMPKDVKFSEIPARWQIYEESVVISALEGSNPVSVFNIFFEYGMEPDYNLDRAGNTTSFAIRSGLVDLVRLFFEKGANPNGWHSMQQEAYLGSAARRPTSDMLKLLIEKGTKLESSQALRQAAECGRLNNILYLLDLGVDINELYTKDKYPTGYEITGCSLHAAVRGSELWEGSGKASKGETVRFLLAWGAKAELVDGKGRTALQLAAELGEDEVVGVFEQQSIEK